MNIFIENIYSNPTYFFSVALIVVFSVCLHEYFHAQVAYWEGDYTIVEKGHLTLNPLVQMGPVSILVFCLVGIAWGCVPVEPSLIRRRWGMLRISLAGPLANLLLFMIAWILFPVVLIFSTNELLINFVFLLGVYNFVLFTLNMLPAPGLDGWGVASELFPTMNKIRSELVKGAFVFILFLAFIGIGYLYNAGAMAMRTSGILYYFLKGGAGV